MDASLNPHPPAFARSQSANETKELRGLAPLELVQALDALSISEDMDRTAYINKVLHDHVKEKTHKAMLLSRMLRGNPYVAEPSGGAGS